jgi:hypothetical protein
MKLVRKRKWGICLKDIFPHELLYLADFIQDGSFISPSARAGGYTMIRCPFSFH